MLKNDVKNISSECQVVIFNWQNNIVSERFSLSQLSDSTPLDISKYVQEVTFTKNIGEPAGTFELTLPNDRDWKDVIQRGCWGIIYMSQDGGLSIPTKNNQAPKDSLVHSESVDSILAELDLQVIQSESGDETSGKVFEGIDVPDINLLKQQTNKIRGIVFIERVTAKGTMGGERGEFDVEFSVTGRDFGVAYLENEIWYNRLYAEGKLQEAAAGELRIKGSRNTADLLTTLHQAFFSPLDLGITLEGDSIAKSVPLQWLLPQKLFQALNIAPRDGGPPYFGNIPDLLDFSDTLCSYPVENPMTLINGKAWDRLKSYSIEPFHELFCETDANGLPKLVFRYIPWKITTGEALGELNDLVTALKDVDSVDVAAIDIIDFDLGEDTHSRFNYFLTTTDTSLFSANDSVANFNDTDPSTGFPRIQKNSIRRYGLRLMYSTVNSLIQLGSEEVDSDLMTLHNELMLEYWNNSVFMESGSMTIIGNNDVKVGKIISIADDAPYNGGKIFYIEGYSDRFVSDDKGAGLWTQSLTLTRGIFPGAVGKRAKPYTDNGEFTEKG